MIYIIALGNENLDVSFRGYARLKKTGNIYLRSEMLECSKFLTDRGFSFQTFDSFYEEEEDFDVLNEKIWQTLLDFAREGDICYAVDGCGLEDIVAARLSKGGCKLYPAAPKGVACLAKVGATKWTSVSADDYIKDQTARAVPTVIYEIDTFEKACDVKLKIMKEFGDDISVVYSDAKIHKIKAWEIDNYASFSYKTSCFVCPEELSKRTVFTYADLEEVVAYLRSENGCPWDREQTHQSIRSNMAEEAYEAMEAIDAGDPFMLEEELGDVLLQVALHAQIAKEEGTFDGGNVATSICKKMISRHSHIFGEDVATTAGETLEIWEANKQKEKHQETYTDTLRAVPKTFPSLMKAQKIKKRCAKANFDWKNAGDCLAKVKEELCEVETAMAENSNIYEEIGDLLFAVSCLASHLKVEAETALDDACKKVVDRFEILENLAIERGIILTSLEEKEYDDLYKEAKNLHKNAEDWEE
ncbi:MAG: nucleoside triphosphate pyrophosphohydrolase [Bacillota bacterium]